MAFYFICDLTGESISNQKFCAAGCPIAIGEYSTTGALPTEIHIEDILNLEVYLTLGEISKGNVIPLNSLFEGAYGECYHADARDIGCGESVMSITCWLVYRDEPESGCCLRRIAGNWKTRKLYSDDYSYDWPSVGKGYLLFSFKGTIEQLLGRKLQPGESEVTVELVTAYLNVYLVISDEQRVAEHFPFNEVISYSKFVDIKGPDFGWTVKILNPVPPPSPPEPIFVADLCSSPTGELAPDKQFGIKVTIANQNQYYGGEYYVGAYCQGHYIDLGSGTISAGQQKTQTFTTTANALAGTQITESEYLSYAVVTGYVDAEGKHETDRWSPTPLAVIVGAPSPTCTPGETKCVGYDLYTCSAASKWELTKKNVAECGYVPGKVPWKWIGIGGGIVAAIGGGLALLSRRKRRK